MRKINHAKFYFMVCIIVLLISYCGFLYGDKSELTKRKETVLYVPWGDDNAKISYRTQDKDDPRIIYEVPAAVNSFWVGEDDVLYLLENGKTIKKYKNEVYIGSLDIGINGYVNDFAILNNQILAVTLHELIVFSQTGKMLRGKRVFGMVRSGKGVEKMIVFNDVIAITYDPVISDSQEYLISPACLDKNSFEVVDCGRYAQVFMEGQVQDFSEKYYLTNNVNSGRIEVFSIDGKQHFVTDLDPVVYSEKIDFLYNSIFRIKGEYIYMLSPSETGLSILRVRFKDAKMGNGWPGSDQMNLLK